MGDKQEEIEAEGNDAQLLVSFLAIRDVLCPRCGYSLRGLQTNTCPECSNPLWVDIGGGPKHDILHTLGVVGLASGVGFGSILAGYFFVERLTGASYFRMIDPPLLALYATALICGLLIWLWCKKLSHISRMSRVGRLCLVLGCFAVSVLGGVAFSLTIP